jgi:hypothetical protein
VSPAGTPPASASPTPATTGQAGIPADLHWGPASMIPPVRATTTPPAPPAGRFRRAVRRIDAALTWPLRLVSTAMRKWPTPTAAALAAVGVAMVAVYAFGAGQATGRHQGVALGRQQAAAEKPQTSEQYWAEQAAGSPEVRTVQSTGTGPFTRVVITPEGKAYVDDFRDGRLMPAGRGGELGLPCSLLEPQAHSWALPGQKGCSAVITVMGHAWEIRGGGVGDLLPVPDSVMHRALGEAELCEGPRYVTPGPGEH